MDKPPNGIIRHVMNIYACSDSRKPKWIYASDGSSSSFLYLVRSAFLSEIHAFSLEDRQIGRTLPNIYFVIQLTADIPASQLVLLSNGLWMYEYDVVIKFGENDIRAWFEWDRVGMPSLGKARGVEFTIPSKYL